MLQKVGVARKWNRYEAVPAPMKILQTPLLSSHWKNPAVWNLMLISMMLGRQKPESSADPVLKSKGTEARLPPFPGRLHHRREYPFNRYRFEDSLGTPEAVSNWNRWAVQKRPGNNCHSIYSHYNQTLGLGYYEYFLLCVS